MGNDVSLVNGGHFYTLEKRLIEAYLDDLLRVGIMLLLSIEIGRQELLS